MARVYCSLHRLMLRLVPRKTVGAQCVASWRVQCPSLSGADPQRRLSSDKEGATKKKRRRKWECVEKQRRELTRIETALGIAGPESWRGVYTSAVIAVGGRSLLNHYGNSLTAILRSLRPEALEGPARDGRAGTMRQHWDDNENVGAFLRDLVREHSISCVEDWKRVTVAQIREAGGGTLLNRHGGKLGLLTWAYTTPAASPAPAHATSSPQDSHSADESLTVRENENGGVGAHHQQEAETVMESDLERGQQESNWTPEKNVEERLRVRVPHGYWNDPKNRRAFLETFMRERNIHRPEDWRGVTAADVGKAGGASLLWGKHKGSILRMLQAELPERDITWENVCRFAPKGHWKCKENRKEVLDRIAIQCGIEEAEQWRALDTSDFVRLGARSVLQYYGNSAARMLNDIYGVDPSLVRRLMPSHHWGNAANRRKFLDSFASARGLDGSPESWQSVTISDVSEGGGRGLIEHFNGSLLAVLEETYGSSFGDARRSRAALPQSYWNDDEKLKSFVKDLEKDLCLSSPGDWARVSRQQIVQCNGGSSLLSAMPLAEALSRTYPGRDWHSLLGRSSALKKSSQRGLSLAVAAIIGNRPDRQLHTPM